MGAALKKLVKYIKNDENISRPFIRCIFNLKYSPYHKILLIKNIVKQKNYIIKTFYPEGTFTNYFTKLAPNLQERQTTVKIPSVNLYKFKNATVHPDSSAINVKNVLYVTRTYNERFDEGYVQIHDQKNAKVQINTTEYIKSGFFLCGNGSWNWFHFLIEIIPKLLFASREYTKTILLSEIILEIPSMQKIIELLNEHNFEILYLKQAKTYFIESLYFINDFNHITFNPLNELVTSDETFYNAKILKDFSNKIIKKINFTKKETPAHLFLYRKNTHRIAKNQDEILNYLKPYGFVPVCLEELQLEDQINYFKNAKFVVGISGAAWANLIFCRKSPKAIYFITKKSEDFCAFSSLAKIFDVDFYGQTYESEKHHYSNDFFIDINRFQKLFESINDE